MDISMIVLMVVRALGGLGRTELEKLLCKIDKIVYESPTELDNELWFKILLNTMKAHEPAEVPPVAGE